MDTVKQLLNWLEPDTRSTGAFIAGAATCIAGALVVLARAVDGRQHAGKKIQRARKLRDDSLSRAEEIVFNYNSSHPKMDSSLILSLSLAELTNKLQDGLLRPEDVFYTYISKAVDVNKKLNCCTTILMESFEHLKRLDSNKRGLLYGIPVSIKENIAYKNYDTTCGVLINLDCPVKKDAVIVEVLRRQGAIPFVKTNVSQSMLSYDCSNIIYGQTVNPHNLEKTSGGSSGGEAALISGGGSVLGIGSDIGGSIRIPAAFCGICGFKPTAGRLSKMGIGSICPGQKSVSGSPGPIAKDVDSLALCMQALLCDHMFALDPTVPPLPFKVELYKTSQSLRIGYMESDGITQPTPSMIRSLRKVRVLLEEAGHTLVPYSPLRMKDALHLISKGIFADGGVNLLQKLKGGPIDPSLRSQVYPFYLPCWLRKTLSFLIRPLSPRGSFLLYGTTGVGSIAELWDQHAAVQDYIHETIAEWRKCNIDVLLCPMFGPAYNFLYCSSLSFPLSYTAIYNLLNFPAGVVPVSTVTTEDEEELCHYQGMSQDRWDRLFKKALSGGRGLPIAVQCVAPPWQDELCLRFMKEVEVLVKQSKGY
ncbi:fatty-acid amide hydrolase 1 [Corythoichthys intestinalis]|uniref:fatty-acid amide hydrolase 1 n=1 Tax=Corythoichthys intestinalis TaxID=161448 RepID=UPI0025A5992B|nr:fatty-acid amide hydrolase 1 [Corythoichthys intestinalis]XP_061790646.1 vitamin D3 hydroxylase-associated protein-like [Nerophis lumbriciformis]